MGGFSFLYICFMAKTFGASVSTVYTTLKDLVNKDQQGFITPAVFNSFAQVAQVKIFNSFFDNLKDARRTTKAGLDPGRDKARAKRIEEDLASFSKKVTITKASGVFNVATASGGGDLARIISISTAGSILLDQSTKKPIEICYDEEKIERVLISNLSSPTEDFPVALVSDDIYVFPTSINKIEVRYYKYPEGRVTTTGARTSSLPTYSTTAASQIDFELPEHYVSDLVIEIAKMAGLNLRDSDVVSYSTNEATSNAQQQKH